MWVWMELQVERTRDVLAIKRAYAKRLKSTRPDDDAAAYQRLREAFEQALAWAKQASHEDAAASGDAHVVPQAILAPVPDGTTPARSMPDDGVPFARADNALERGSTIPEAQAVPDADPMPIDADDGIVDDRPLDAGWQAPEQIARDTHTYWQAYGNAALAARWLLVRGELDRLPFVLRHEASNRMASLVIDMPHLPHTFVEALAEYFQWGLDFRAMQSLDAERALALSRRLRDLGIPRISDPAILRRYADVLRLRNLLAAGRRRTAWLLAMLLPERTFERWKALDAQQCRQLGIGGDLAEAVGQRLGQAYALRALMHPIAIGLLISYVPEDDPVEAVSRVIMAAMSGTLAILLTWVVAIWFQRRIDAVRAFVARRRAWLATEPGHRRFGAGVGLALLSALVALPSMPPATTSAAEWAAWFVLVAVALVVVWSGTVARLMLVPVSLALSLVLRDLLPDSVPTASIVSLAFVWTLCAHWLLMRHCDHVLTFYRSPLTYFRPRKAWGWLLWLVFFKGVLAGAAALAVLSLPLTLIVQAIGYGQRFAFATIGIGLCGGFVLSRTVEDAGLRNVGPLLCMLAVAIAQSLLQAIATRVARLRIFR